MRALLLPLLLLAADPPGQPPRYPLGPLPERSLTEPGPAFVLSDLAYRVARQSEMEQAFFARARFKHWGFVEGFVDGQGRGLGLQTQRWRLRLFDDPSLTNLQAGWRGASVLLDASAERRPPQDGSGWTIDGEAGVRLTPDLEAFVAVLADTDRPRPAPARPLGEQRFALLWQRGTRLDLSAAVSHAESRNDAGFRVETWRASASADATAWDGEASLEAGYQRTDVFVPRGEVFLSAAVRRIVGTRLLLDGHSSNRWEPGVKWFDHGLGVGVGWHGRRVRLARAGEAAARTLALTRRARAFGNNERRVYDPGGRRALRERLAISPQRDELAEELRALQRAEVAERRLELLGAAFAEHVEAVTGTRQRQLAFVLGVPWPPQPPWRHDEASVPFLSARFTRVQTRYGNGFLSHTHEAALSAELNRENALLLRWRRPGLTPLDVSRISGRSGSWEVEYVYALGR